MSFTKFYWRFYWLHFDEKLTYLIWFSRPYHYHCACATATWTGDIYQREKLPITLAEVLYLTVYGEVFTFSNWEKEEVISVILKLLFKDMADERGQKHGDPDFDYYPDSDLSPEWLTEYYDDVYEEVQESYPVHFYIHITITFLRSLRPRMKICSKICMERAPLSH